MKEKRKKSFTSPFCGTNISGLTWKFTSATFADIICDVQYLML